MSSFRSDPAQSTSVSRPVDPSARMHVRRNTACDRDDAALQCVADVALRPLPAAMICSSSVTVAAAGSIAPMS